MGGSHRRPWRHVLALMAVAGLALVAPPVHAAPLPAEPAPAPPEPAPLADPIGMVGQMGGVVVNINTEMGYAGAVGAGTGIVLDPGGVVLTNNHVVAGATGINAVSVANNQVYEVDVLGFDRSHDVAVIRLRGAAGLPPAVIGDSSTLAVGDPVVAMGNAGGQGGTPSAVNGRILGLNETVSAEDEVTGSTETLNGLIHADTPLRSGDSGGPMVNPAGEVIGMNTAASGNFRFDQQGGEGFAIPINEAMAIAGQIRSGNQSGTVHIGDTAFFGVGVVDFNGIGAKVVRVLEHTPAEQAGIAPEDLIVAVDGTPVDSATALTAVMDRKHPGDTVEVTWRGPFSGEQSARVTLAPGPIG
jgi:S1-C subfamily serine protease